MPIKLEYILKRVQDLPSLPTSAIRVIALTKNPKTSVQDLAIVIEQDPALTAGILRQANSSYYGFERRISSIQEAIVLLGFLVVRGLVISTAVAPLLKMKLVGYEIDQEGLWNHSLLAATAAKQLCQYLKLSYGDIAFTAGLLHDIGKLVISIYLEEVGAYFLKKATEAKFTYVELEEKVIGYNHATVGGLLAKTWNLPEDLVEAISYHHAPFHAPKYLELACVIHVANRLASSLGISGGVDSLFNPLHPKALDLLGLKRYDLEILKGDLERLIVDPIILV